MKHLKLLLLLVFIISCQSNNSETNEYLSEVPLLSVKATTSFEDAATSIYKPFRIAVNKGYVVVIDSQDWSLHLLSKEGKYLDKDGGLGRGPGEFQQIAQVQFAENGNLYAYDNKAYKLSKYIIDENQLIFQESFALPQYSPYLMENIYFSPTDTIGVFKKTKYPDENPMFAVHQLTQDFQMGEKILSIPGNDYLNINGRRMDNFFGNTTIWKYYNNKFYYTGSHDITMSIMNLVDKQVRVNSIGKIPKQMNTLAKIQHMEDKYSMIFQRYPQIEESMRRAETLPLVIDFLPTENKIYYTTVNATQDPGQILVYNKITNTIKKINVPPLFNIYAVDGNLLYGIDHTDEKQELKVFSIN